MNRYDRSIKNQGENFMKKKFFLTIAILLCLTVICAILIACNEENSTENNLTDVSETPGEELPGEDNSEEETPTVYYTVIFDSLGGSEVASVQVSAGTKIAAPATPTKVGYNFSGWFKDAGCTTAWDFSTDAVNGDITLYANWVGEDGKILAVANATISDYSIFMVVQKDVEYVSLADAVTIGGSGTWRLYRDILGSQEIPTKIATGSSGTLSDGNNIFYIVSTSSDGQQVRTYTLTVHRSYAAAVTVKDPYGNPAFYGNFYTYFETVNIDKSFTGYTVNGWTCSDSYWQDNGYITGASTFTPSCKPNTYTVTLNAEDGTISSGSATKSVAYDSRYSLPVPTKTGYSFAGWYYQGTQQTDSKGSSLSGWGIAFDTTFYAEWEINEYYVNARSSDSDAGTVSGSGYYDYHDRVTLTANANPGYNFIGWYEGESKLTGELSYSFIMPAENKNYTAKWEPIQYSINLVISGETVWKTETAGIGSKLSIPDAEDGMSFYGWIGADNEYYALSDGKVIKDLAEDRILYACFYQSDATPIASVDEINGILASGKYELVRSIDLGGAEWTPIGIKGSPFTGEFNGNGYTVSNFKITTTADGYAGLFGYNKGVIENLGVENFTVNVSYRGNVYAGGLVGYNSGDITNSYATGKVSATSTSTSTSIYTSARAYAGGLVGYNSGDITNSYATGKVSATSTSGSTSSASAYAGGLVGYNDGGSITNSYATGKVSATADDDDAYAGGLVGSNYEGSITNSYATGNVSATSSRSAAYAGGLAGYNSGSILNSYATGEVSATSSAYYARAGGLVGYKDGGSITNSYATGKVSATSTSTATASYSYAYAGGLVGYNTSSGSITNSYATGEVSATADYSACAGGLVGSNYEGSITNSYAAGDVRASSTYTSTSSAYYARAGGLVGHNNSGDITNCYRYSGQTIKYLTSSNTEGTKEDLTTLQSVSFHTSTLGWDESVWNFVEGAFPTLKNAGTAIAR